MNQEKQQSVMTFVPQINQSSLDAESVFKDKNFVNKLVKNHDEKIVKAQEKVKFEQDKKYTFKPEINKISKEIADRSQMSYIGNSFNETMTSNDRCE